MNGQAAPNARFAPDAPCEARPAGAIEGATHSVLGICDDASTLAFRLETLADRLMGISPACERKPEPIAGSQLGELSDAIGSTVYQMGRLRDVVNRLESL